MSSMFSIGSPYVIELPNKRMQAIAASASKPDSGRSHKKMNEDITEILQSLANRFCERRAYGCLHQFLPAYFSPNGLTDGWKDCRTALANTRAFCRDDLTTDEAKDLHKAMNLIDKMLAER